MFVYHEKQMEGVSLCGQHCLNNLLQGPEFGPGDLGQIARRLDAREEAMMKTSAPTPKKATKKRPEFIHSDQRTGVFCVEVLQAALNSRYIPF